MKSDGNRGEEAGSLVMGMILLCLRAGPLKDQKFTVMFQVMLHREEDWTATTDV